LATKNLIVRVLAETSRLSKDLNRAETRIAKFEKGLQSAGKLVAGVFAADAVGDFVKQAWNAADAMNAVETSFNKTGGSLADIRAATGGMVSDLQLMQATVNAANLGIDAKQLPQFFEFATIRARETGQEVDKLLNDIISGTARGSIQILDNLGITTQELGEGFASAANKAEIVANIISEKIGGAGQPALEDVVSTTEKLGAAWENFTTAFGTFINQEGNAANGTLNLLAQALNNVADKLDAPNADSVRGTVIQIQALQQELELVSSGWVTFWRNVTGNGEAHEEAIQRTKDELENLQKKLEYRQAAETYVTQTEKVAEVTHDARKAWELANAEAQKNLDLMDAMASMNNSLWSGMADGISELYGQFSIGNAPGIDEILADADAEYFNTFGENFDKMAKKTNEATTQMVIDLGGLASAFDGLGTQGFNFGENILSALAGFAGAFGKQLIGIGLGKIALDNLFKGPGGGIAALAIGAALVAASNKAKQFGQNATSSIANGGGFSGGASSPVVASGGSAGSPFKFELTLGPKVLVDGIDYEMKRREYTGG
jgi:hypothetical protein